MEEAEIRAATPPRAFTPELHLHLSKSIADRRLAARGDLISDVTGDIPFCRRHVRRFLRGTELDACAEHFRDANCLLKGLAVKPCRSSQAVQTLDGVDLQLRRRLLLRVIDHPIQLTATLRHDECQLAEELG